MEVLEHVRTWRYYTMVRTREIELFTLLFEHVGKTNDCFELV